MVYNASAVSDRLILLRIYTHQHARTARHTSDTAMVRFGYVENDARNKFYSNECLCCVRCTLDVVSPSSMRRQQQPIGCYTRITIVARHSRAHLQVHIATKEMGTNQTWFGYEKNFAMPYDCSWYCGCDEVKLAHRLTPLSAYECVCICVRALGTSTSSHALGMLHFIHRRTHIREVSRYGHAAYSFVSRA